MKENESIKLYESLKQLSKTQFDEICFYLQKEYGYDLNLISLDKVPLADSAMQLIHLLEQYPNGFNHLQNALERQSIKSGNPLMPQKKTRIIIFSLGLLVLLIAIYLAKSGNTVIIDIDNNSQSPIHIEQDKEINVYGIPPVRFQQLSEELGVTQVALRNFFKITEKKQVPIDDLDKTLREIAKHYKELMAKVATLNPDDPSVAKLIKQAKQALEKGEFDQAEQLFNQASELGIEAAQQAQEIANKRLVSAAESLAANGKLKMTHKKILPNKNHHLHHKPFYTSSRLVLDSLFSDSAHHDIPENNNYHILRKIETKGNLARMIATDISKLFIPRPNFFLIFSGV